MKRLIISLFLISCLTVSGQSIFQKTYGGMFGDWANSIQQTTDGGFIITGATNSFTASWYHDLYLVKTDYDGNLVWSRSYGGDEGNETGYSVLQTEDNGFLVAGRTYSYGMGGSDVYIIRTDAAGDTLWTKTFGGTLNDGCEYLIRTGDGNFIFAGYTGGGTGYSEYDILLVKMDIDGSIIWSKSYGGPYDDFGKAVQQTNDGGYILLGEGSGFGSGNWEVLLIKTDANGALLWTKTYGNVNPDFGNDVIITNDGGFLLTGFYGGAAASDQGSFLMKTDPAGNIEWSKLYDFSANRIIGTSDGGYIMTGTKTQDACLIKTNASGDTLWTKTYGGNDDDDGRSVIQLSSGGFVMTGSFKSYPVNYYGNVYLIKTDPYGNSGCYETDRTILISGTEINTSIASLQIDQTGIPGNTLTETHEDGFGSVLCYTTGIQRDNKPAEKITVSPNPFNSKTRLYSNSRLNNATIKIHNSIGILVLELINVSGNSAEIKSENLNPGLYYLHLKDGDNKYRTEKIIVY